MITTYKHSNLKGTSADINLSAVNIIVGPNRSSKSAKMEGLALAATGKAFIGGTAAKIAELIGKGDSSASASITVDDGTVATWTIKQALKDGKLTNSAKHGCIGPSDCDELFGDYITPADFWGLTNEAKWKVVGGLVSGESESIANQARPIFEALKLPVNKGVDLLTNLALAQAHVHEKVAGQKRLRDDISNALVPPEEYKGPPLAELHAERQTVEQFVKAQGDARRTRAERERATASRTSNIESLIKTLRSQVSLLSEGQTNLERMEAGIERLKPLCQSLAAKTTTDNSLQAKCRQGTIRQGIIDTLSKCQSDIEQVRDMLVYVFGCGDYRGNDIAGQAHELSKAAWNLAARFTGVTGFPQAEHPMLDATLKPVKHIEFDGILAIIESMPTQWRPLKADEWTNAYMYLAEDAKTLASGLRKCESTVAGTKAQIAKLEAEAQVQSATTVDICDESDYISAVTRLDELGKLINKANEWPAFMTRQSEAVSKIDAIDECIATLQSHDSKLRSLRGELLKMAAAPVEAKANELLAACGCRLEPLELRIQSTEKTSSLSIQSVSGIDVSSMCGAEKILYGVALLWAIQSLSNVKSPLILAEVAELDGDTFAAFLNGLSQVVSRGNVVLASWAMPSHIPNGVTVIDCQLSKA